MFRLKDEDIVRGSIRRAARRMTKMGEDAWRYDFLDSRRLNSRSSLPPPRSPVAENEKSGE